MKKLCLTPHAKYVLLNIRGGIVVLLTGISAIILLESMVTVLSTDVPYVFNVLGVLGWCAALAMSLVFIPKWFYDNLEECT